MCMLERERGGGGRRRLRTEKERSRKGKKIRRNEIKRDKLVAQPPTNTTPPVVLKLVVGASVQDSLKPLLW